MTNHNRFRCLVYFYFFAFLLIKKWIKLKIINNKYTHFSLLSSYPNRFTFYYNSFHYFPFPPISLPTSKDSIAVARKIKTKLQWLFYIKKWRTRTNNPKQTPKRFLLTYICMPTYVYPRMPELLALWLCLVLAEIDQEDL